MRTIGGSTVRTKFNFCLDDFVSLAISTLIKRRNENNFFGLKMGSVLPKKNLKETHASSKIKSMYPSIGLWSLTALPYNCLPLV